MRIPAFRVTRRAAGAASRGALVLIAVVVGTCLVLGLFWYGTSFTTRLGDDALAERFAADASGRDVMHAVEEVSRRLEEGRPGMDRWADALVLASRRPEESVRVASAWCMQFDSERDSFVARLREMVATDRSTLVRRNAATSLARSGDPAGLGELRAMLAPLAVTAPVVGVVRSVASIDAVVRETDLLAHIDTDAGATVEVRAPIPGAVAETFVADGTTVAAGASLLSVRSSEAHLTNAVTALALVGEDEDVARLRALADPRSGASESIRTAATRAADWIEQRIEK